MPKIKCPTPTKQAFPSEMLAIRRALRASATMGRGMRPYSCGCGRWHLSSKQSRSSAA